LTPLDDWELVDTEAITMDIDVLLQELVVSSYKMIPIFFPCDLFPLLKYQQIGSRCLSVLSWKLAHRKLVMRRWIPQGSIARTTDQFKGVMEVHC
jgi:hypothetical protein